MSTHSIDDVLLQSDWCRPFSCVVTAMTVVKTTASMIMTILRILFSPFDKQNSVIAFPLYTIALTLFKSRETRLSSETQ